MSQFKLTADELGVFIRKIYEEACYGYMDLKDSVCDRMLRDFLDGREIVSTLETNVMAAMPPVSMQTTVTGNSLLNSDVIITSSSGAHAWLSQQEYEEMVAGSVLPSSDEGVVLRDDTPILRDENYVRMELNFEGNESERH